MKTILKNNIIVDNPTPSILKFAVNELVVTNPTYSTLKRLGKEDTIRFKHIPEKMCLYSANGLKLLLPFGVLNSIWPMIKDSNYELDFNDHGETEFKHMVSSQSLFDYQKEAVDAMMKNKGGVLVGGCGSGKTQCGIEIAHRIGKKFLWLTHTKDLLKQSYNRFKSLYPNIKLGTITEGKIDMGEDGTIATIQTMANLDPYMYKDDFDVVITDECFPAGTKVTTIDGYKNIEDIKVGDTVLSFNHKTNQKEFKKVKNLFVKTSSNLKKVKVCDKIIIATENHPFYTQRGYVAVGDLKDGDYVLQDLWQTVNKRECVTFKMEPREEKWIHLLFTPMFSKKRKKKAKLHSGTKEKIFGEYEKIEFYTSLNEKAFRGNEMEQSYVGCKCCEENDRNKIEEWYITSTDKKQGWKWENESIPNNYCIGVRENGDSLDFRICCPNKKDKGAKNLYPTCYKIDVAIPEMKIAIEVDGASHFGKKAKERDQKKTNFLVGLGWKVFRITNKQIKKNVQEALSFITLK